MNFFKHSDRITIFVLSILAIYSQQQAFGVTISVPAAKDNTLFRYDPIDPNTALNSNGSGDFISSGRSASRDEIRRGLIQFDLSSVPSNMQVVPGSVHLQMRVVSIPKKDTLPRPFWFAPLSGLGGPWGEGVSDADVAVSGSGSGAPAQSGDATWFHTSYDPNIHNTTTFDPGATGFWTLQGALGAAVTNPAAIFGPAAGTTASTEGFVDFTSASMEADINAWLANPSSNFGWLIIGDESITGGGDASSKRDFASRQHANATFHPLLTFEIIPVPEPPTASLCTLALITTTCIRRPRHRLGSSGWSDNGKLDRTPNRKI